MFLWLNFYYLILFLNVVMCQRRVVGGQRVDKSYMVYLVPALFMDATRSRPTTAFFCGGSIISPSFVISSAACILYNNKKWVIAGYNKYLTKNELSTDKCAQKYARKIAYECAHTGYPKANDVNISGASKWHQGDIGIAKVETPFNFMDNGYFEYCSYPPNAISYTTVRETAIAGSDVMVLGWGSRRYNRPPGFDHDINEKYLMAATTVVAETEKCKDTYRNSLPTGVNLDQVFNKYTICTQGMSDVNIHGTYNGGAKARRDNNSNKTVKFEDLYLYYHTTSDTVTYYSTSGNKIINSSRRSSDPGPCQNDHGGPLVVWFGGREYLAGIASAFLVNEHMECVGPYLYTSIASAAKFLNCTMNHELAVQGQCKDCNDILDEEADLDKPLESPNKTQDYWLYSD